MGALTQADIIEFSNFLMQLKNQMSRSKCVCGVSFILILKGIMTFKSQRVHAFLVNKNTNYNKNKEESEMENPTYSFREMNLALQVI